MYAKKKTIRRHFAAHRKSKTVNRLINYDLVIVVKNGSWPTIRPETFCVKFVIHQVCVCTSVRVCVLFPFVSDRNKTRSCVQRFGPSSDFGPLFWMKCLMGRWLILYLMNSG